METYTLFNDAFPESVLNETNSERSEAGGMRKNLNSGIAFSPAYFF